MRRARAEAQPLQQQLDEYERMEAELKAQAEAELKASYEASGENQIVYCRQATAVASISTLRSNARPVTPIRLLAG